MGDKKKLDKLRSEIEAGKYYKSPTGDDKWTAQDFDKANKQLKSCKPQPCVV